MSEINRLLNEMQEIHGRVTKISQDFHKMLDSRKLNLTPEEKLEQKVSYIFGQAEGISKEQIRIQLLGE